MDSSNDILVGVVRVWSEITTCGNINECDTCFVVVEVGGCVARFSTMVQRSRSKL